MNEKTQSHQDYRQPPEWDKHEGTWLQWPLEKLEKNYQLKLEHTWLMMAEVLHQHENVHIIVNDMAHRDHVAHMLAYYGIGPQNIELHVIPIDDVWIRDNGPIFVVNDAGELAITNWIFNGWGERFPYARDDKVPAAVGEALSVPIFDAPLVLEGGALSVNGKGTLLATLTSIVDPYRNPGKSQAEIEEILGQYLGLTHFIWLTGAGRGECEKWGDTTDSHIDIVARFTDESTVLYNWIDEESDPRHEFLVRSLEELQAATTESGEPLTLVPLPSPQNGVYAISATSSWRTSALTDAAYTNYYVANGVVLVPVFGNVNDAHAKAIVGEHFPGRDIVGIDAVTLTEGGGAIGCVTQPQPFARCDDS